MRLTQGLTACSSCPLLFPGVNISVFFFRCIHKAGCFFRGNKKYATTVVFCKIIHFNRKQRRQWVSTSQHDGVSCFHFHDAVTEIYLCSGRRSPSCWWFQHLATVYVPSKAANIPCIGEVFTITEKAPNRAFSWAFSWLKVPTGTFKLKILLRHFAEQVPKQTWKWDTD